MCVFYLGLCLIKYFVTDFCWLKKIMLLLCSKFLLVGILVYNIHYRIIRVVDENEDKTSSLSDIQSQIMP